MGYRKAQRRIEVSLASHTVYGQDGEPPVAYARGKSLDEYLVLQGFKAPAEGDERSPIVRQLEEFAASLMSWNLEREDGTPIPCTSDAFFGEVDNDLAITLATDWIERLGGKVDAPLQESSPDGEQSPVPSAIPMAPLSEHPLPTSVPA